MANAIMGMKDYNDTAASASVARNNNDTMLKKVQVWQGK